VVAIDLKDRLVVKNLIPRRRGMLAEWTKRDYRVKKPSDLFDVAKDYTRPRRDPSTLFKIPSIHFDGTMTLSEERYGRKFKYSAAKRIHQGNVIASRIGIMSGATALVDKEFVGRSSLTSSGSYNPK
jgi:hypothetical protein